jgi:ABC-type uncharacterized transport system substrate-binding protein
MSIGKNTRKPVAAASPMPRIIDSATSDMDHTKRLFVLMPATAAAKEASKEIPIVCVTLVDPVGLGWAASEARPGGAVTGILGTVEGLPGKTTAT